MIKINLLPVKAAKKAEAGRRKVFLIAGAYVVLVVALYGAYQIISVGVEKIEQQNRTLNDQIEALRKEVGDLDKIKAQITEMRDQERVVKELVDGRSGPVLMLRELSWILTPGRGPTYDRIAYEKQVAKDPNAGFNQGWDPKRVWLTKLEDKSHQLIVEGAAKSNEDVAEF